VVNWRDFRASIGGPGLARGVVPPPGRPPGTPDGAEAVCVAGGRIVLVRSHWRAEVRVQRWQPRLEMTHRRLVPADEACGV
jgi:hypothetical protein